MGLPDPVVRDHRRLLDRLLRPRGVRLRGRGPAPVRRPHRRERRVAINTIGPFWDGNEVWLVVGGAAIFAAFPGWYATWFSAGYLARRAAARRVDHPRRVLRVPRQGRLGPLARTVERDLTVGSVLAPLVLGVALGDLVAGLPSADGQEFTGSFWDLFTPYGLWTGVTLVVLCLLHGATFLGLKTTDEVRDCAHTPPARRLAWAWRSSWSRRSRCGRSSCPTRAAGASCCSRSPWWQSSPRP